MEDITKEDIEVALEEIDVAFVTDVINYMIETNNEDFNNLVVRMDTAFTNREQNSGISTFNAGALDWGDISPLVTVGSAVLPTVISALTNPYVIVFLIIIVLVTYVACNFQYTKIGFSVFCSHVFKSLSYSKSFFAMINGYIVEGKEYLGSIKDSTLSKVKELGTSILSGGEFSIEEITGVLTEVEINNIKESLIDIESSGVDLSSVSIIKGNDYTEILSEITKITSGLDNLAYSGASYTSDAYSIISSIFSNDYSLNPLYIIVNSNGYYICSVLKIVYRSGYWRYSGLPTCNTDSSVPIGGFPSVTYTSTSINFDVSNLGYKDVYNSVRYRFGTLRYLDSYSNLYGDEISSIPWDSSTKIYVYNPYVSLPSLDVEKLPLITPPSISSKTTIGDLEDSYTTAISSGVVTVDNLNELNPGVYNPGITTDIPTDTPIDSAGTGTFDGVWSEIWEFIKSIFIPSVSILSFVNYENSLIGQILNFGDLDLLNFKQIKPYFEFYVLGNKVELPLGDVLEENSFVGMSLVNIIRSVTSVFFVVSAITFLKNRFDIQRTQD